MVNETTAREEQQEFSFWMQIIHAAHSAKKKVAFAFVFVVDQMNEWNTNRLCAQCCMLYIKYIGKEPHRLACAVTYMKKKFCELRDKWKESCTCKCIYWCCVCNTISLWQYRVHLNDLLCESILLRKKINVLLYTTRILLVFFCFAAVMLAFVPKLQGKRHTTGMEEKQHGEREIFDDRNRFPSPSSTSRRKPFEIVRKRTFMEYLPHGYEYRNEIWMNVRAI